MQLSKFVTNITVSSTLFRANQSVNNYNKSTSVIQTKDLANWHFLSGQASHNHYQITISWSLSKPHLFQFFQANYDCKFGENYIPKMLRYNNQNSFKDWLMRNKMLGQKNFLDLTFWQGRVHKAETGGPNIFDQMTELKDQIWSEDQILNIKNPLCISTIV